MNNKRKQSDLQILLHVYKEKNYYKETVLNCHFHQDSCTNIF